MNLVLRILLALASFAAGVRPLSATTQMGETTCTVERITDGDTIRCGGERVRLLLIDSPEENQAPFGRAAHAFLEAILPVGSTAKLVTDVEARDQFGRLLAYVYLIDGRMVNRIMVRQGFAVPLVVPPNVRHVSEIRTAADSARVAKLGLWAVDAFACLPEDFRDGLCAHGAADGNTTAVDSGTNQPENIMPLVGDSRAGCDSSYADICIPPPPPDLDCGDVPFRRFRVTGADPHRMDGDHDGVACEGS